jgi:hypothetical protein
MNRKSIVFFFCIMILGVGCSPKHISVKDYIRNSDSASIAFFQRSDSVNTIKIKDKTSIQKLGSFIDAGKTTENGKCREDGSIWFYEGQKKKMEVGFSLNGDCNYFSYMMNDKIYARTMSPEATKYLTGIMEIATDTL